MESRLSKTWIFQAHLHSHSFHFLHMCMHILSMYLDIGNPSVFHMLNHLFHLEVEMLAMKMVQHMEPSAFFTGGLNNSATNLTFCLFELSINPAIQTKARHIILETFEKFNGQFTYEIMMDMPYIDQIIEGVKLTFESQKFLH